MRTNRLLDQKGVIRLKALFWIVFFAALLYGAYKIVPPYVSFYMTKTDVEEEAKIAHMYTDESLAQRILRNAEAWSVPLTKDDIEIVRDRDSISITVRYTDRIVFIGGFVEEIPHEIIVESELKETSGILK